jgi:hypothetical protein
MNSEIEATIVMRCRIEKQNYANRTGFTLNPAITGGDLPFLLDSIYSGCALLFLNICKEKIDFSTRNVIYLWIK